MKIKIEREIMSEKGQLSFKQKCSGTMHKLLGTTPNDGMQPKEVFSYSFAGLGQNLICGLVGSFVSYYFTNGLLMAPVTVGLIMLFVRIFDALNDPIMGSVVDRTRTKDGKCRPYLKWMPIPIGVFTVLLFLPLPPKTISTVAIMTTIYVIWSIVYTIVDVPYWGLGTAMTGDTEKRNTMLTVARLFCTLGAGLISVMIPQITNSWIKAYTDANGQIMNGNEALAAEQLRNNFWWLALILVLIAIPTFWIGYKNTKERFGSDAKPATLSHNLKLLTKNTPLLMVVLFGILGAGRTLYMYSGVYLAQYNLSAVGVSFMGMEGLGLFTLITIAVVPGGLIASLMVPWLSKKFGKKGILLWSHVFGALVLFVMYGVGWRQDWALIINLVGLILLGIPQGIANIVTYSMISDSVEYLELKTGERAEGICFAMQTFINKIGMAIGAAVTCFALGWAHIDADNAITYSIAGNAQGLDLLFALSVLVPAVSMIICVIPLFFYKFNEKDQKEAVVTISQRKVKAQEIIEKVKTENNSDVIIPIDGVIIKSIADKISMEEAALSFIEKESD